MPGFCLLPWGSEVVHELIPCQSVKNKALPGLDEPFDYDLSAQLANVPAIITMYDLLRLSPDIRQAFVKALSEADKYVHQIEVHDV